MWTHLWTHLCTYLKLFYKLLQLIFRLTPLTSAAETILCSVFSSQILQYTEIKIVVHWKFRRKYGPVSHLFSCIYTTALGPFPSQTISMYIVHMWLQKGAMHSIYLSAEKHVVCNYTWTIITRSPWIALHQNYPINKCIFSFIKCDKENVVFGLSYFIHQWVHFLVQKKIMNSMVLRVFFLHQMSL